MRQITIERLLTVKTVNGEASVDFYPGTSAGLHTITYALLSQTSPTALDSAVGTGSSSSTTIGATNEQFTITVVQSPSSDHLIDPSDMTTQSPQSFNGQSNNWSIIMNVLVEEDDNDGNNTTFGGGLQEGVQVAFSATGVQISQDGVRYGNSVTTVSNSSGVAQIYVKSQRSTGTVTARVVGSNNLFATHKVTYFFNSPYIEYVSGNNQEGAIGGRVENPLVVRVLDGPGGRPVPNQVVQFDVSAASLAADNAATRQFIPVSGTKVFVTEQNTLDIFAGSRPASGSYPETATNSQPRAAAGSNADPIFVQTDDQGQAQVYLSLGNGDDLRTTDNVEATDLVHRVTATTPNGDPRNGVNFKADAESDSRAAQLVIVSGGGQTSSGIGARLSDPLVVRTRSVLGYLLAGVTIRFTAPDGTLRNHGNTGLAEGSPAAGGNEIEVVTGSDGTASVWYNVGQLRGGRRVKAEVQGESGTTQYDFEIEEVTFGVDGGRGSGTNPGTNRPITVNPYLSISLTSSNRNPGET